MIQVLANQSLNVYNLSCDPNYFCKKQAFMRQLTKFQKNLPPIPPERKLFSADSGLDAAAASEVVAEGEDFTSSPPCILVSDESPLP
mmetsp:Transcript_19048/g.27547  ORF Transcript_19048/g.27547 Transcript_19048/m.27547 type:complete len:87 (-) Transcript_19048:317-577(-)